MKKSNPDSYLDLKEKYLVSITALEYRAYHLKLLTFEENNLIGINTFLEQHQLDIQFLCKLFDIEPAFFNAFTQSKISYFDKNAVLPFNNKLSRLKS